MFSKEQRKENGYHLSHFTLLMPKSPLEWELGAFNHLCLVHGRFLSLVFSDFYVFELILA